MIPLALAVPIVAFTGSDKVTAKISSDSTTGRWRRRSRRLAGLAGANDRMPVGKAVAICNRSMKSPGTAGSN
jgi:hypothetical protein